MTKFTAGRGLGILLVAAGTLHFVVPGGFDNIVPPALPLEPRFWTYLSGLAELVVGGLLLAPMTAKVGSTYLRQLGVWFAAGLFVLVYPANIYMAIDWMDRGLFDQLIAFARLPLQFALLYWCWSVNKQIKEYVTISS